MQDNYPAVILSLLLKELKIPVTRRTIVNEFSLHPNRTSILAMSDLLTNWNIPSGAFSFTFEELVESKIPTPFIAHVSKDIFVVVKFFSDQKVTVCNGRGKDQMMTTNEFRNRYRGSVLVAEKNDNSGELEYKENHRKELIDKWRSPVVIAAALVILFTALWTRNFFTPEILGRGALLVFLKTIGLITSILLLIQSIDATNPLVNKLCGIGVKSDCKAILSSRAAKVTDELSWSEVGFFYFAGTWLVILFNNNHLPLLKMLAILNLLSLPYTVYSIYYQWQIAKQWCIFCCTVQIILWLEALTFFSYLNSPLHLISLVDFVKLAIGMASPIVVWTYIKPYFIKAQQIDTLTDQLNNLKYNTVYFNNIMAQQAQYLLPAENDVITLGNREADCVITIVSNPYCVNCEFVHKTLDDWLQKRDDIKVQLLFSTQEDETSAVNIAIEHIMNLRLAFDDDNYIVKALNDWYGHTYKNYSAWADNYPVKKTAIVFEVLKKQKSWCELTNIKGTPAIFINGRLLHNLYRISEIKYLISS